MFTAGALLFGWIIGWAIVYDFVGWPLDVVSFIIAIGTMLQGIRMVHNAIKHNAYVALLQAMAPKFEIWNEQKKKAGLS
jgi:hypothetical protein